MGNWFPLAVIKAIGRSSSRHSWSAVYGDQTPSTSPWSSILKSQRSVDSRGSNSFAHAFTGRGSSSFSKGYRLSLPETMADYGYIIGPTNHLKLLQVINLPEMTTDSILASCPNLERHVGVVVVPSAHYEWLPQTRPPPSSGATSSNWFRI